MRREFHRRDPQGGMALDVLGERAVELADRAACRPLIELHRFDEAAEVDELADFGAFAELVQHDGLQRKRAALPRPLAKEPIETAERPVVIPAFEQSMD